MTWGLIWLMLVLKIPVAALLYLVWWAVRQDTEPEGGSDGGDGGTKVYPHGDRRPAPPRWPRRRGPHGDPAAPPAPPRSRPPVVARARHAEHHR
ncbi:MAG TPA: hypothetical protein VI318_23875 [Baekduia sp.]